MHTSKRRPPAAATAPAAASGSHAVGSASHLGPSRPCMAIQLGDSLLTMPSLTPPEHRTSQALKTMKLVKSTSAAENHNSEPPSCAAKGS